MNLCRVCHVNAPKYKCSTCLIPYCSLPCYSTHKETPCQRPEPKTSKETKPSQQLVDDSEEDDTRLTTEQLEKMATSDQVRSFLEYPQIRELITKIDMAPQPDKLLDSIRQEDSVFEDFVQSLLKSTNTNQHHSP